MQTNIKFFITAIHQLIYYPYVTRRPMKGSIGVFIQPLHIPFYHNPIPPYKEPNKVIIFLVYVA